MSATMADDKRVFGLMNAVATNIDRLRQSISALRQLHDRWKDGNGTFINLIAQLTALKSNLGEMQDWMNFAINDMHSQLLMDLNVLMTSCGMLVRNLDALTVQLRLPDYDNADWAIKLKFAIAGRSMNRLRKVAKRQTDAVNLLLAACKCHTTAQRKILLHKSRQIRKEDASSLSALVQRSKWNSRCIDTLTRISRIIQWLRVLFYLRLFKGEEDQMPTQQDYLDAAAAMRSEAIDRRLEEDATTLRRETKLVLIGMANSGKELIMRQMKVLYAEGYPRDERIEYRFAVRSTVRVLMHAIIDLLKDTGVNLSEDLNQDFAVLLQEVETINVGSITPAAVHALENIWQSDTFSTIYVKNFEIDFPQYASYFAHEIERISDRDYVPSEADIIRLNQSIGGIKELRFSWDEIDVHLFNINGYIPDQFRRRWLHQLEGATALVYTVDVSTYDRAFFGQPNESALLDDFATFEAWVNSPKFAGSSIILLLNNFTRFREKLQHSPLSTFFPEYQPGTDPVTTARRYILRRFKDVNRSKLSIYSFWVDLDMGDNQHLYAALKKTITHIQQRKARSEVWETSTVGKTSTAGIASPARSGTVTTLASSSRG
ncbi:guanine nucleotide-binding protein-like protein alpha-3 subunit [Lindgomyces ingoldianus]|uniref:Guanine nucleotide-binding protein-like protein alpha-3 subunit n=1 Tax=Lindgomyces ingoldianus TaxID=673940 RepID=A0ACB6QY88_9PLEO|nr:guanine nucleotide-binding protein-like protein alpha-3 subunit [Lindgomyces ingoldianus]KAF2471825.1 guanine nucleotide-binding protein-like protein alpha-3 subunit [Lindgomyces ingoldianus]